MTSIHDYINSQSDRFIDLVVFKTLMEIMSNDWTYLSPKLITETMGYSKVSVFYAEILRIRYKENIDYKEINGEHEFVVKYNKLYPVNYHTGGKTQKYYLVSKKALIMMIAKSKAIKSDRYLEYFYEINAIILKYYEENKQHEVELTNSAEHKKHTDDQTKKYAELELAESKSGEVYFVHEENNLEYFKIGFTSDLERRISQLQSGNMRVLLNYVSIQTDQPAELESRIHAELSDKLVHGEWYKITTDEINVLVEKYK